MDAWKKYASYDFNLIKVEAEVNVALHRLSIYVYM